MAGHDLLSPGQSFAGRYRIERFLAEGGFGAVYVAEQLATEARVAIKVLWPQVLQAKDAVDKFQQEARIAGRVNSDHIVRVIDAGFDEPSQMPFLVMELLEGDDLSRLVERQGPLSPPLVVEYLRQTASALDRAHGYVDRNGEHKPIVHRDLKPENLFIARRDNGETILKVLDFGIAKVLTATSNVSRDVKGTPLFMAFEQAGGGAITPQTDIWAFGLIAFHLLTGQSYWKAAHQADASLMQLFGEVLSMPLTPPTHRAAELGLPPVLPPAFDAWFFHCVNRDISQRFATAGAAAAVLAEVFGITPSLSRSADSLAQVIPRDPGLVPQAPMQPVAQAVTGMPYGAGTMRSAGAVGGATEGALAISGVTPAPKRSPLVPVLAAGVVVLIVGAIGIGVLVKGRQSTAAAGSVASETRDLTVSPTTTANPSVSVEPITAPAASETSTVPSPTSAPKPTATAKSTSTAPEAASAKPSAPKPSATPTKPPKEPGLYDDR